MQKYFVIVILLIVMLTIGASVLSTNQDEDELIVGTWILDDEWGSNVKLVFNENGTLENYIDNALFETYNWVIYKETSPVCGKVVPTAINFSYLRTENTSNSEDVYCYEIMSLTEGVLQLRYLEGYKFATYNKE